MADFFINIEDLKAQSLIHGNVETDLLTVILTRCQRQYLTAMFGKLMYDDLLTKSGAGSLDAYETELLDEWAIPYLVVKTEEMAALNFNIEIRNKSVGTSNDEYQTAADFTTIDKFKNDLVKQAQFYKTGLVKYIADNPTKFPLYPADCDEVEGGGDSHSFVFGVSTRMVR